MANRKRTPGNRREAKQRAQERRLRTLHRRRAAVTGVWAGPAAKVDRAYWSTVGRAALRHLRSTDRARMREVVYRPVCMELSDDRKTQLFFTLGPDGHSPPRLQTYFTAADLGMLPPDAIRAHEGAHEVTGIDPSLVVDALESATVDSWRYDDDRGLWATVPGRLHTDAVGALRDAADRARPRILRGLFDTHAGLSVAATAAAAETAAAETAAVETAAAETTAAETTAAETTAAETTVAETAAETADSESEIEIEVDVGDDSDTDAYPSDSAAPHGGPICIVIRIS